MHKWRKQRAAARMPATLVCGQVRDRVLVLNISEDGARLSGAPPMPAGAMIALQLMNHRLPGKVAWQRGDAAGIAFQPALTAHVLGLLRRLV
ncbi:PilZ domain-containing protein [Roseobacter sp. S98]|uniref:PilZ domain-containing protein n=1 Tax=Roseobacter algicola (ex Choi et al. 2025) (nom. illeg.) TaxID=3092138 RepID=UPI003F51A646